MNLDRPPWPLFFAKVAKNAKGDPVDLPDSRVVRENPRNGFLTISKKKGITYAEESSGSIIAVEDSSATFALEVGPGSLDVVVTQEEERLLLPSLGRELIAFRRAYIDIRSLGSAVRELSGMIEFNDITEQDLQDFLTDYPELLLFDTYDASMPHIVLEAPNGRQIPDFIVRDTVDKFWDIVEIKKPNARISKKPSRPTPSAAVMEAVAQVREYQMLLEDPTVLARVRNIYGVEFEAPKAHIIIGRTSTSPRIDRVAHRDLSARVMSWDYLVELNRWKYGG
ncbi:DUF4263 domain-containing protein [Nocardia sp. SYP-A9097]|uniref:Shedu anti-phage system protein SduA domain-containing protein n=1 Tax=Nocardia sp. SYP-A9097 TaxID=2663237 RepID=UPI00129BAC9C|nr:Shedu anti-phage system protein SduA domain-containing protein [Nocardia sp. SYP-A9097]MRH92216.1 DUF4263 domain-containing protein [Nocardia sp. SYP-A9097]